MHIPQTQALSARSSEDGSWSSKNAARWREVGSYLEKHGVLRKHRVDWYEYFSWRCGYCNKILVGSYSELLVNAKRHLEKHSVEVE